MGTTHRVGKSPLPLDRRPLPSSRGRATGVASAMALLQQSVGNAAVQRLVAPLSRTQVVRALGFYRQQPGRYTPSIIEQIQAAVGTPATGVMAEDDVQAVARKQASLNVGQTPALKIDGMAGPRTLPQVFRIGLAKDDVLSSYTKAAASAWKDPTKSEEAIAVEIVDKLMTPRLAALGIPALKPAVDEHDFRGAFDAGNWALLLDRGQFRPGKRHDLKATTSTIYHECRHAEQVFKVAQMMGGTRKTVEQIHKRTGLRLDIAQVAKDKPIAPGTMEALIAHGWDDASNSAAGKDARRRNNIELSAALAARDKAQADCDADPSPANKAKLEAAKARYQRAVDAHDQIPDEFDAERLEARVEQGFGAAP